MRGETLAVPSVSAVPNCRNAPFLGTLRDAGNANSEPRRGPTARPRRVPMRADASMSHPRHGDRTSRGPARPKRLGRSGSLVKGARRARCIFSRLVSFQTAPQQEARAEMTGWVAFRTGQFESVRYCAAPRGRGDVKMRHSNFRSLTRMSRLCRASVASLSHHRHVPVAFAGQLRGEEDRPRAQKCVSHAFAMRLGSCAHIGTWLNNVERRSSRSAGVWLCGARGEDHEQHFFAAGAPTPVSFGCHAVVRHCMIPARCINRTAPPA